MAKAIHSMIRVLDETGRVVRVIPGRRRRARDPDPPRVPDAAATPPA